MDKLRVGLQVNIQRSDGRVHEALISELQTGTQSVSVEWFEQGETKAKELSLAALLRCNPGIIKSNISVAPLNGNNGAQQAIRPSRHSVASTQAKHLPPPATTVTEKPKPMASQAANAEIEKLSVGMQVDIERSDGRVHSAMITQIVREKNSVLVEWFEKGETKGKEVEMKAVVRNNPAIFKSAGIVASSSIMALPPNVSIQTISASVMTTSTTSSASGSQTSRPAARHSIAAQPQPIFQPANLNITINMPQSPEPMSSISAKDARRKTSHGHTEKDKRRTQVLNKSHSSHNGQVGPKKGKVSTKVPELVPEMDEEEDIVDVLEAPIKLEASTPPLQNDFAENEPIIVEPQPAQKSQLLENISELARNREQRRAQQDQARRQRELQMQIDPGNPNWEFLAMIRDYQSQLVYRPLRMCDEVVDNRICVCVRKRPMSKKELANKEVEVVTIPDKDHVVVHQPQQKVDLTKYLVNQNFRFDYTFNENSTNELVYKFTAQPLVRTIFQRGFATCFAYGQTGSGKTHTMGGVMEGRHQDCTNGVYAMTASDVFTLLHSHEYRAEQLSVSCSFFEIYGKTVFDLLAKKAKLRILEDGKRLVQVVGLKEFKVHSVEEVLKLITTGSNQRTAGQTSANSNSSRSHAVFQIILRRREKNTDALYGKFSLIDLAGNERGADTISSDRQTRLEGAEINKSLLALKECIRAMGRDEQHIPFRGSKLTLILRDSFVGRNAKTCMIAMVSPGISSVENTMNTLRYADRVKELGGATEPVEETELGEESLWTGDE